jgi:hypothetical protein
MDTFRASPHNMGWMAKPRLPRNANSTPSCVAKWRVGKPAPTHDGALKSSHRCGFGLARIWRRIEFNRDRVNVHLTHLHLIATPRLSQLREWVTLAPDGDRLAFPACRPRGVPSGPIG